MATRKMALGGMGKKMAGVAKAAAGKAAEAGKAKEAQKSAMADKMKSAYTDFMAKKSADVQSQKDSAAKAKEAQKFAMDDKMKSAMAKKSAAPAPYSEASRQANMKANPGGGGGGIGSVPPPQVRAKLDAAKAAARPMARPAMPARPMARPAMPARPAGTVSPNAAKMVGKTFGGMGMKKGGRAKK